MNLKNYWISKLIIILGIFFFNSANADIKIKASQQVSNFLNQIKNFASEKDQLKKEEKSEQILKLAVKRMLPGGPLSKKQLTKLKLYPGENHPHELQKPKIINFENLNSKNIVK